MKSKVDLYIMLPCTQNNIFPNEIVSNNDADLFLNELSEVAKYEFKSKLCERLERNFLKNIELVCKTDDRDCPVILGKQNAFVTVTNFKNTNISIIYIIAIDVSVSLTHLLDQVSRRELTLTENNKEYFLREWIKNFGYESTGKAFYASCLSGLSKEEAPYIIAGEAYNNDAEYHIISETVSKILNENHAQYSSYDSYISECGIAYVMKDFNENYSERVQIECIMIFIMELVVLKITAISAVNNDIVSSFSNKNVSIDEIRNINEKFSLSLPLWDLRHFRYFLAQEFANRVENAFNVSQFINEYDKNRIFLEQLINTRKMVISENEAKALRIFATVISALQAIPLLFSIILYVLEGKEIGITQIIAFFTSSVIVLTLVFIIFKRRKKINK